MTFIKRNARELAWIAGNAFFVAFNLFMSAHTAWPGLYAVFFAAHVACAGFWVWAIFDNADMDTREAEIRALTLRTIDEREESGQWDHETATLIRRTLNGEEAQ